MSASVAVVLIQYSRCKSRAIVKSRAKSRAIVKSRAKSRAFVKSRAKSRAIVRKTFAVSHLKDSKVCDCFQEAVCDEVESKWSVDMSVSEMWEVIKGSMVSVVGSILGFESRKQPDWFKESSVVLSELIEKRNALFGKWLSSGANCDCQRYVV